jgi:hypothetical protein
MSSALRGGQSWLPPAFRRRFFCLPLLLAAVANAHVVSMSSGDLTITGVQAHYELRMPLYEVAHVQNPEQALLSHIRFAGATLTASACSSDPARDTYLCTADYTFAAPPEQLDVECTFPAITVPNHVHLLRAQLNGKPDQAVFDNAFPRATLRFRPPTAVEVAITQSAAGFVRALGGAVQILFLAALVLAARSKKELLSLAAMFVLGQIAAAIVVPHTTWQPPPRFVEAAMALALAYLSVEILLLPQAGSRWIVAGILGGFQGLYFALFLQNTGYQPALVLTGAVAAQAILIAIFALVFSHIARVAKAIRPVRISAAALLIFGMAWFFIRLRS